jgi:uncharacterized membrane protein YkoI
MKLVVGTIFIMASSLGHANGVRVDEAFRLASDGIIKPFEGLNQTALEVRRGRIVNTELENNRGNYIYKVIILDSKGQEWEVKVDAVTGEVLEEETDS